MAEEKLKRLTGKELDELLAANSKPVRFPESYEELQEQSVDDWLKDYDSDKPAKTWK